MSESRHRFPASFLVGWAASALALRRRPLSRDARGLLREAPPEVLGREHVPANGPYIVVMNHYEREGLGVWWPAMAVSAALGPPEIRWIITNRFYRYRLLGRIRVPEALVKCALLLVARVYDCIPIERRREAVTARAIALRRMRRALDQPHHATPTRLGATPEGEYGAGRALGQPYPSSGKALAWLSRGDVPLLPIGISEREGRLTVRIGEPVTLPWPGLRQARTQRDELAAYVMHLLADVLPPEQRGSWLPLREVRS